MDERRRIPQRRLPARKSFPSRTLIFPKNISRRSAGRAVRYGTVVRAIDYAGKQWEMVSALAFLVLLTCVVGTLSSAGNDRAVLNSAERNRRYALSEFLVPPPLPQLPQRVFPPGRTGRNASPRPVESLGYFSKFMNWLNPFGGGSTVEIPPPPPPEPFHPPQFHQPHAPPSGPPSGPPLVTPQQVYNAPHPAVFDRPPLPQPPPPINVYNKPHQQGKDKNCNPCNKVPWLPMGHGASGGAYLPPINQEGHIGVVNGEYLPPSSHGHDAHHGPVVAASQEVRVPDFFYAPPLLPGQNGEVPPIGPLPNPHLYPGPMPPLFKAEAFDYPSRSNHPLEGNTGHLEVPRPTGHETDQSLSSPTQNGPTNYSGDQNLGIPQQGQAIYESHQVSSSGHTGLSNQGFDQLHSHTNGAQVDSFSSASHENKQGSVIHSNHNSEVSVPSNQDYDASRINQFTGPSVSDSFGQTSFGNNQQFVDSSGLNFQRTDQSVPPSAVANDHYAYGSSGSGQQTYNSGDISSSVGTVRDSHASGTNGFSNVENPIHFEESPLTDLTKTSESRTDSPSISSSSATFIDLDGTSNTKTTLDYDSRTNPFQVQQEINRLDPSGGTNESFLNYTTESSLIKDFFSINQNNQAKWTDSKGTSSSVVNGGLQSPETLFVAPPSQSIDSWSVIVSTTMRTSQDETPLDNLGNNRDSSGTNFNFRQNGAKRNKQVQVIIPYTSQYTPLPFHSSYDNKGTVERTQPRKVSFLDVSNRDTYVSEESRNEVKVISPPESSTVSAKLNSLDDRTMQVVSTTTEAVPNTGTKKVNNSIDVHRLQKNIDNWTIQEYSRGTTFSTVVPSSSRPYLQPSKKIPSEYLTTTESGEHKDSLHDHENNVKSFALAGFSFNDIEDEGSNRFEESRIQSVHVENPSNNEQSNITSANENKVNTTKTKKQESSWKDFPVSISPVDKERVYVVTPQTTTTVATERLEVENKSSTKSSKKGSVVYSKSIKSKQDEFEKIERAYQVLPQAVNNLAMASTGPETLPLWGIMEHEEFASLGQNEDENNDDESAVAPILYTGHSKVSRARR
ncbi:hypothetical protein KPH14_008613 [Odynerus spinipes]|uniref:Uncharacterized protein n=1 Tax=Odynerus spinipes TaxID=1348599 RepID=A0AAD9RSN0_9HYME|nr:hypothetical protein KPH14_008613 [Odynerus spinipes]